MKAPTPQPDSPEEILREFGEYTSGGEDLLDDDLAMLTEALAKLDQYYTNKFLEGCAKWSDQLCYNCGNKTIEVDDRARCPYCGVHEAIKNLKEQNHG